MHRRSYYTAAIHPGSNAAAPVTPREPVFTERGQDLFR